MRAHKTWVLFSNRKGEKHFTLRIRGTCVVVQLVPQSWTCRTATEVHESRLVRLVQCYSALHYMQNMISWFSGTTTRLRGRLLCTFFFKLPLKHRFSHLTNQTRREQIPYGLSAMLEQQILKLSQQKQAVNITKLLRANQPSDTFNSKDLLVQVRLVVSNLTFTSAAFNRSVLLPPSADCYLHSGH